MATTAGAFIGNRLAENGAEIPIYRAAVPPSEKLAMPLKAPLSPGSRTVYALGDVHGVLSELMRVLELISLDGAKLGDQRPRVIGLGDYVDRGPESRGVIEVLSSDEMLEAFDPIFLRGNHDAAMSSVLSGHNVSDWLKHGGDKALLSYGVNPRGKKPNQWGDEFRAAVPDHHAEFLLDLEICHVEGDFFFCHAGIDPADGLDGQNAVTLVHGARSFLSWPGVPGLTVVHGHWASPEVVVTPARIGVDTGCGWPDGHLSAVAIDPDGSVRVIS